MSYTEVITPENFSATENHVIAKVFLVDNQESFEEISAVIGNTYDPMRLKIYTDLCQISDDKNYFELFEKILSIAADRGVFVSVFFVVDFHQYDHVESFIERLNTYDREMERHCIRPMLAIKCQCTQFCKGHINHIGAIVRWKSRWNLMEK